MTSEILYVDDEADIREIAEMAIGLDPSLIVRTCGSGQEGFEQARQSPPDLMLLDVMMPGLDGPSVLSLLQEDPVTASVPVVFITARTQEQEIAHLKQLGARGVIAKPFDPMTLAEQVRSFLDG